MFYTIYKTTNLLNGKFYIGKHQTKNLNDGYFGSGKLLVRAVKKHGIQNFVTDIIIVYEHEWQMNLAEKILATVDDEMSYNLCSGGKGGFSYINQSGLANYSKAGKAGALKSNYGTMRKKNPIIEAKRIASARIGVKKFFQSEAGIARKLILLSNLNSKDSILKRKQTFAMMGHAKGSKNSQFGKKKSDETKKKIAESIKKSWQVRKGLV